MKITNEDNMLMMARYEDNHFDLAIVDPPYGIGAEQGYGQSNNKKVHNRLKQWDNETPTEEYFNELFRVSKNQIIWGVIILTYHLQGVLLFGINCSKVRTFQIAKWLGLLLIK